jgi:propionate CoA-transferase
LCEIAPGARMREDVLDKLGFKPRVADPLKSMDTRIFCSGQMGLGKHVNGESHV